MCLSIWRLLMAFGVCIIRRSPFNQSGEDIVQGKVIIPRGLGFWGLASSSYIVIFNSSYKLEVINTYFLFTVINIWESSCSWWDCSVDWEGWMCLPGDDNSSSPLFHSVPHNCKVFWSDLYTLGENDIADLRASFDIQWFCSCFFLFYY